MRRGNEFDLYYLNKDDRLKFLFLAIKHPFFSRNKDIRLYLAKWFFYDVINVLDRLVELALKHYEDLDILQARSWVEGELLYKSCHHECTLFDAICKNSVLFYQLFQKPWFWGCGFGMRAESSISPIGFVYLSFQLFWFVPLEENRYDVSYKFNSEEFLELMDALNNK